MKLQIILTSIIGFIVIISGYVIMSANLNSINYTLSSIKSDLSEINNCVELERLKYQLDRIEFMNLDFIVNKANGISDAKIYEVIQNRYKNQFKLKLDSQEILW